MKKKEFVFHPAIRIFEFIIQLFFEYKIFNRG